MEVKEYIEELRELVDIDSGTETKDGVTKVARVFERKFKSIGWHAELKDCGNTVGNAVFATNKPGADKYDVLLVGHMDTVFPEGTVKERPMTHDDKYVYGPAVGDMKGGLLSIFWAVKNLEKADRDRLSIAVLMNPDEETGSNYSSAIIDELASRSRYACVCEPSRGEGGSLVKARKGSARFEFTFSGVAAHAGNAPEVGRSAIHEMAHFIVDIANLANKEKGTTTNVGVVTGGDAINTISDKAWAGLDVRFWENDEFDRIQKAVEERVKKSFTPDIGISMIRTVHIPAMFPSPAMEELMKSVEKCGEEVGVDVRWMGVGAFSDGNHIAAQGTPVIDGLGPTGWHFHSPKEYILIDSIIPRIKLLQQVLVTL